MNEPHRPHRSWTSQQDKETPRTEAEADDLAFDMWTGSADGHRPRRPPPLADPGGRTPFLAIGIVMCLLIGALVVIGGGLMITSIVKARWLASGTQSTQN